MQEIWKDIQGYEGLYQVSNLGRVRSLGHTIHRTDGTTAFYRGRILTPVGRPYLNVCLSKGPQLERPRIHRLVAEAFVPNPEGFDQVDHIDCNKKNNRADNLRWCTRSQNSQYAYANGCMDGIRTYYDLDLETRERITAPHRRPVIRDDGETYPSTTAAAKALGVTRSAVSHVLCGLVETCKGHTFQYA